MCCRILEDLAPEEYYACSEESQSYSPAKATWKYKGSWAALRWKALIRGGDAGQQEHALSPKMLFLVAMPGAPSSFLFLVAFCE